MYRKRYLAVSLIVPVVPARLRQEFSDRLQIAFREVMAQFSSGYPRVMADGLQEEPPIGAWRCLFSQRWVMSQLFRRRSSATYHA